MKTKYTFLENRLIFQNPSREAAPVEQDNFGMTDTIEGKVEDLEAQIKETRDLFGEIDKMTENEAIEAYDKLEVFSVKIRLLKNKIKGDNDIPIGLKEQLTRKLDELSVYVKDLLEDLYTLGKDEYGLNVAMISDLSDIGKSKDIYPDNDWIYNFKGLNYSNQRRVIERIEDMINIASGSRKVVFWESFAGEHEKQKDNPGYDWMEFIDDYIMQGYGDLLSDEYLNDDGKPTDKWFSIFNALGKKDQANLLHRLPTEMREEVWLRLNSI